MEIDTGNRRQKITINALRHYVDRLTKIEENEGEEIILFNYQLRSDLNNEQKKAEELIEYIQKNRLEISDSEFGGQKSIFYEESMRKTLTTALLYYYNGMIESSKIVSEIFSTTPQLPLLKEEIEFCKKFLDYLHAEHNLDTKTS
jgi:hypothetical protein